jgi:hypothetical protein
MSNSQWAVIQQSVTQPRVKIEMAVFAFHCFPKRIEIQPISRISHRGLKTGSPRKKQFWRSW